MTTSSTVVQINDPNYLNHSKHLIKKGNLVFLPNTSPTKTAYSGFLIKKNQLEYPVLVKVYYSAENKYLHKDNLSLRLEILKIHHAIHRNDPFALYINKQNLNEFIETVKRQSSNSWQVISVS